MRKTRERVDELEACFEHLQERVDGLRDQVQLLESTLRPTRAMEYFWNNFQDTLAWCQKYDANSEEWRKLIHLAWEMMDKYLAALRKSPWGKDDTD